MYRATAEIVSGSKVFAGGKWLKCIGNKRVSVGERIWTDGRCVYGHFQEAQQPPVITSDGDEAIPILAGKQCYIFYRGKLQLIGELDKFYSLMINDTRGNVFVYDDDTGARIDGNIREELKAANIDKAGNHYYLTQIYEIEVDGKIVGDMRIWKNGEVVAICSSPEKFADEVYDSVPMPGFGGIPDKEASGEPMQKWNNIIYSINRKYHFIENPECWSLYQDYYVQKYTRYGDGDSIRWNNASEDQYIFCDKKTILRHSTASMNRADIWSAPMRYESPITWNSATIALQDGFYCQAKPEPFIEDGVSRTGEAYHYEHENFHKTFFTPQGNKIFELDGRVEYEPLITRIAGGYLVKLDDYNVSYIYLCKNNTLELIYQTKSSQYTTIKNQRLRSMKHYKNWHKRIKEINLNQTA